MLEDHIELIKQYDKQSTAAECETLIHHLDAVVKQTRILMERAHAILERRIAEERQIALGFRSPDFPKAQQIGVS